MTLTAAELDGLRGSVRDHLGSFRQVQGQRDGSGEARRRMWAGLAVDLGLAGLGIAERHGGLGSEPDVRRMLLEELGRALVPGPAMPTLAAARVLGASGNDALAQQWLPLVAEGGCVAAFSVARGLTARPEGAGGWRLDGEVRAVVEGEDADLLLVVAAPPDGEAQAFAVDATSPGVVVTAAPATDPTRPLSSVAFDGTRAVAVGDIDATRLVSLVAQDLAFEQLGGARWCLEASRDYARIRTQFGRTIGSFQAVKHLLADVVLENEAAWAATTGLQDESDGTVGADALTGSLVHVLASEAYLRAAGTAVQVHGAIAVTDETDVHLHLKRATTTRQLLGGMDLHHRRTLDAVLATSR